MATTACHTLLESSFHRQHFHRKEYAAILNRLKVTELQTDYTSKVATEIQRILNYCGHPRGVTAPCHTFLESSFHTQHLPC